MTPRWQAVLSVDRSYIVLDANVTLHLMETAGKLMINESMFANRLNKTSQATAVSAILLGLSRVPAAPDFFR